MPSSPETHLPSKDSAKVHASGGRQLLESIICLAITVILFRTFQVEGFVISTGSMAPSLLGYHKRVTCPTCGHLFAYGVAFDKSQETLDADTESSDGEEDGKISNAGRSPSRLHHHRTLTTCPNCGQDSIDVTTVPRNHGDQLLVHKNAFQLRPPRRWEVIVFRNPQKPTQVYVKRLVGLPGETVQIIDGDVFINGQINRKNLEDQRATRILVYEHQHRPAEEAGWQPRWFIDDADTKWEQHRNQFSINNISTEWRAGETPVSWVSYGHWIRSGGRHKTSVAVEADPEQLVLPDVPYSPVRYDRITKRLICTGVLSVEWRNRLLNANRGPGLSAAVEKLYEQSHLVPVSDLYGYNQPIGRTESRAIRDLMFEAKVHIREGGGRFLLQMTDGNQVFDCELDAGTKQIRFLVDGKSDPLRKISLAGAFPVKPFLLEMSLIDRQVVVAIDGKRVFTPWKIPRRETFSVAPRIPVRFGVTDLRIEIDSLNLFRDIYYTSRQGSGSSFRNAIDAPCQLAVDEFFVLGDNSPVSYDSRSWLNPAVNRRFLLGKPFLVHLPSRPGRVKIGDRVTYIRIPDFSRIRYIP